jgi:predicted RNA methylase
MTDTQRLAARQARILNLQYLLGEAIEDAGCSWGETACAIGFALAVVIDINECDRERVAMARQIAAKLMLAAEARGTLGIAERMQ